MSYLTPLHAYGFFNPKPQLTQMNKKVDVKNQILYLVDYSFKIASERWNSEEKKNADQVLAEFNFRNFFNQNLENDEILRILKKNYSFSQFECLDPYSNPFSEFKKQIPSFKKDPENHIPENMQAICHVLHVNKNSKIYQPNQMKLIPDIGLSLITYSPTLGFYINEQCKLGLFVYNQEIKVDQFDVFLLNCVQYALAYCGYRFIISTNVANGLIFRLLDTGYITEMHIFSSNKNTTIQKDAGSHNTMIYLYIGKKFFEKRNKNEKYIAIKDEDKPYIQIMEFTSEFDEAFEDVVVNLEKLTNRQDISKMVFAANIPLFKSDSYVEDNIPYKQARRSCFQVDIKKFHSWSHGRTPLGRYFANFDDIHQLNIQYFIKNQLYTFTDVPELYVTNALNPIIPSEHGQKLKKAFEEKMQQKTKTLLSSQNIENIITDALKYLKSIIVECTKDNVQNGIKSDPLELRSSQELTILHAVINSILIMNPHEKTSLPKPTKSKDSSETSSLGSIYQIDTGEGKTLIITCIALLLALRGFKVHIITHIIDLAYDNFYKVRSLFKKAKFSIQPAILIHKEEYDKLVNQYDHERIYQDDDFKDPLGLNTDVLYKNKIIYSTSFNFEATYLTLSEKNPFEQLLSNTICIIDEADGMLIDDLSNGTTISKPILSTVEPVIEKVYDIAENNKDILPGESPKARLEARVDDLKSQMKKELGNPYIIFCHSNLYRLISDADHVREKMEQNLHYFIQERQSFQARFDPSNNTKKTPQIIPYDYKKGVLELNKQFDGYIHQLLAAKANKSITDPTKKVEMEPLSVNYLYTAHPFYLSHYSAICGFTGTIGSKKDEALYKQLYHIDAIRIPRHQPSYRFDMKPVLVDTIEERNNLIYQEIYELGQINKTAAINNNEKKSILVILENPNDVIPIAKLLLDEKGEAKNLVDLYVKTGIPEIDNKYTVNKNIQSTEASSGQEENLNKSDIDDKYIFEEANKPIDVILAGNNYGRGMNADLEVHNGDHLHVIIGYYSHNIRTVQQALGRTGRSGRSGTTKIICLKKEYFSSIKKNSSFDVNSAYQDSQSILQTGDPIQDGRNKVISYLLNTTGHSWIFNDDEIKKDIYKNLPKDFFGKIRNYTINVARSTAVNYVFPFGFNQDDYFLIQTQRIYSLINCPNCRFTWMLIARYYRELILEGWSLFIQGKIDEKIGWERYLSNDFIDETELTLKATSQVAEKLDEIIEQYFDFVKKYTPLDNPDIVQTFLKTTEKVNQSGQKFLMNSKYKKIFMNLKGAKRSMVSLKIGVFPFTSLDEEQTDKGIKIEPRIPIQDPEMKYEKFSITHFLDTIFDKIIGFINDFLAGLTGMQLYLKRTVAGTEFGLCFQPFTTDESRKILTLHDIDLTFIAAINVKSEKVLLAGIMLLLAAILAATFPMIYAVIPTILTNISVKGIKKLLKTIAEAAIDFVLDNVQETIVTMICAFLVLKIKNIMKQKYHNSWIQSVLHFVVSVSPDDNISYNKKFSSGKNKLCSAAIKIGVCIVMLVAAFFTSFKKDPALKNESDEKPVDETINTSKIDALSSQSEKIHAAINNEKMEFKTDENGKEYEYLTHEGTVLDSQKNESEKIAASPEYEVNTEKDYEEELKPLISGANISDLILSDYHPKQIKQKRSKTLLPTRLKPI